ncbi:MAG: type II toxin-antitoxin system RelB family antitoxin [Schwartzia sp. (in: firmicutes)]
MTVAVHLSPRDARIFKKHAARSGMSLSDFAVLSMRERMEDELDRQAYEKAMEEFRANPVTYTLDEVEKELGLS